MSAACPQQPPKKKKMLCVGVPFIHLAGGALQTLHLMFTLSTGDEDVLIAFFFLKRKGKNSPVVGFGHVKDDIL